MDIATIIPKKNVFYNEPMSKHTTFRIGGPAECFVKVETKEQLKGILRYASENKVPVTVIGNGSNLLVLDGGIPGITVKVAIDGYEVRPDDTVVVGSGCKLGHLAKVFAENSLSGFEELSGIPGTIGGAIVMNAGAYQKEIKDVLKCVEVMDCQGNVRVLQNDELKLGYRSSVFKENQGAHRVQGVITEAVLVLTKGNEAEIRSRMQELLQSRKDKQPLEYPSAGSTFKRGQDFITAKLIDEAGLKGYHVGDAYISEKHSGFIVNKGNATAKDVLQLVEYTKEEVYKKFNKKIDLEIEIVGEKE